MLKYSIYILALLFVFRLFKKCNETFVVNIKPGQQSSIILSEQDVFDIIKQEFKVSDSVSKNHLLMMINSYNQIDDQPTNIDGIDIDSFTANVRESIMVMKSNDKEKAIYHYHNNTNGFKKFYESYMIPSVDEEKDENTFQMLNRKYLNEQKKTIEDLIKFFQYMRLFENREIFKNVMSRVGFDLTKYPFDSSVNYSSSVNSNSGQSGGSNSFYIQSGGGNSGSGQSGGNNNPGSGQSGGNNNPGSGQSGGNNNPGSGQSGGNNNPGYGQSGGNNSPGSGQSSGNNNPGSGQSSGNNARLDTLIDGISEKSIPTGRKEEFKALYFEFRTLLTLDQKRMFGIIYNAAESFQGSRNISYDYLTDTVLDFDIFMM